MKKILIPFLIIVFCGVVLAGGANSIPLPVNGSVSGTIVTNTFGTAFNGYLESIYIDLDTTSAVTQTVVIATSQETLLTDTISADTMYRPRYPINNSSGDVVAIATNDYTRAVLANEQLTITVTTASTNVANVIVTPKTMY